MAAGGTETAVRQERLLAQPAAEPRSPHERAHQHETFQHEISVQTEAN
jgi:hypothetical protein